MDDRIRREKIPSPTIDNNSRLRQTVSYGVPFFSQGGGGCLRKEFFSPGSEALDALAAGMTH